MTNDPMFCKMATNTNGPTILHPTIMWCLSC